MSVSRGKLRHIPIAAALVAGVLVLALCASALLSWMAGGWFERDLRLRAELAGTAAAESLRLRWGDPAALRALLGELERDARIVGALACDPARGLVARAGAAPAELSCEAAATQLAGAGAPTAAWRAGPQGARVLASARQVAGTGGVLVLIQDLEFAHGRAGSARALLWGTLLLFAVAAAGVTSMVVRVAWGRWAAGVREVALGRQPPPALQPVLEDVREVVARLTAERELEGERGPWTPHRLKAGLRRELSGERVLLVANREPYIHQRNALGGIDLLHPASGLVTALEPVMRACSGVWVAHGSGSADRETADAAGRLGVPPEAPAYTLRRVWLTPDEERGYYEGYANEGLWPLCHQADTRPAFRSADWEHYRTVNARFADAVCQEADRDDPVVLVQDYHLALVPRLIRERLPRATVITFWHIPWPNAERFGICPQRTALLEGLLGSSIIGFHTQLHCNNLLDAVDRYLESRIDREDDAVIQGGRRTLIRPYPISIEWPSQWSDAARPPAACRQAVRERLKLPADVLLGVGVDRLDYIKGIEERLAAVERALELDPSLRGRLVFVQVAAPSRTAIEKYRELGERVQAAADRINRRFGAEGYQPVALLRAHHEPPAVFELYRAADFVYVSSLHDGMNLVAKEFVAARSDEGGVLILSQFAGASRDLPEALVVNPYDLDQAAEAIIAALRMPQEARQERMRAMRAQVAEFNVYRWAGRMLTDAARVRERSRRTSPPVRPSPRLAGPVSGALREPSAGSN